MESITIECSSENIYQLKLRRNRFWNDGAGLNVLSNKMAINLNVFVLFMKNEVGHDMEGYMIVTK